MQARRGAASPSHFCGIVTDLGAGMDFALSALRTALVAPFTSTSSAGNSVESEKEKRCSLGESAHGKLLSGRSVRAVAVAAVRARGRSCDDGDGVCEHGVAIVFVKYSRVILVLDNCEAVLVSL